MALTITPTDPSGAVIEATRHTVYVKRNWTDSWQVVPFLECLEATNTVAPDMSEAQLRWSVGQTLHPQARIGVVDYLPLYIDQWFLKVMCHTPFGSWCAFVGQIQQEKDDVHGDNRGWQTFKAYGLEVLLTRRHIYGGYVGASPVTVIMDTPIFNKRNRRGESLQGNRSSIAEVTNGTWQVYNFSTDGELWSNLDIINYLGYHFQPYDVVFILYGEYQVLDQIVEEHDLRGKNIFDALNKLIDRRRGLSYRILSTGSGTVGIYVFSLLQFAVNAGGITIPGNPNRRTFYLNGFIDVQDVEVVQNELRQFDEIVVEAEDPIRVTSTYSYAAGDFEEGWSSSLQTEYDSKDDDDRGADKYQNVYRLLKLPAAFTWAGVYPSVDNFANVDPTGAAGFTYWNQDLRFLRRLPFESLDPQTNEAEFREAFAYVERPGESAVYVMLDRLTDLDTAYKNVPIRMADREGGIVLMSNPNHLTALNHFGGTSNQDALVDYQKVKATLQIDTTQYPRVKWDLTGFPWATGSGKTFYQRVPKIEVWAVAANTVEDIQDGAEVLYNSGTATLVRDDTDKLRAIAGLIFALHVQQAATLSYSVKQLLPVAEPGVLVDYADFQRVGTCVLRRQYDFRGNQTHIQTGLAQIDFARWADDG